MKSTKQNKGVRPLKKLVFSFLFFFLFLKLDAQILPFQTPDFKETALENRPTLSAFIDRDGYYWFGGMGLGLTRYDGERVEYYIIPGARTMIMNIIQDKEGYLWCTVNTNTKEPSGVHVSNVPVGDNILSDTLFFTQKHKGIKLLDGAMMAGCLTINEKGTILSSNKTHAVRYSFDENHKMTADTTYSLLDKDPNSSIKSSYITNDNQYFYFTSGEKILRHQNHSLDNEILEEIKINRSVRGRISTYDENNKLWFADADHGIVSIDFENENKMDYIEIPSGADFMVLLKNNMALSANQRGLDLIDINEKNVAKHIGTKEGLTNSNIWGMSVSNNNIMINSKSDFTSLPLHFQAFELIDHEVEIDGKKVLNQNEIYRLYEDIIFPDKKSYVALCTSNGLTLINEEGQYQLLTKKDGLLDERVLGIRSDDENRVWIIENKSKIVCIYPTGQKPSFITKKGTISVFSKNYEIGSFEGVRTSDIFNLSLPSEKGSTYNRNLIAGTKANSIYFFEDGEEPIKLSSNNGFVNPLDRNFVEMDKNGFVFLSSLHGLYKSTSAWTAEYYDEISKNLAKTKNSYMEINEFQDSLFQHIPLVWEKDTFGLCDFMLKANDKLWFGYKGGILTYSMPKNKVTDFIKINSKEATVYSLTQMGDTIWSTSAVGLFAHNVYTHQQIDFIRDVDIPQIETRFGIFKLCKDYSNKLLFTSSKGLMIYDPKIKILHNDDLICKVRDFKFEGNDFGKNKLNIEYIAMDKYKNRKIEYKTKLEGYDDEWSTATNDSKINYTNLNAVFVSKTYNFNLQAKDVNGNWTALREPLKIKVKPPIWFRWWAFIVYGISAYLLIRYLLDRQETNLRKTLLLKEAEKIKEKNIVIQEQINQNELLLKEIHHRVKNNLQTISSLLYLQSASVNDNDAKNALKAVQQRVASMALIHKKLYEENNLSKIEMKGYINLLTENLIDSYAYSGIVNAHYDVDDIKLELDQAIPIGLLLTELVTNSLKYAFPERKSGILNINLKKYDNEISLYVKDNGAGKNLTIKESFGSKLIKLLTLQIDGKRTSGNSEGFWTKINFTIPM